MENAWGASDEAWTRFATTLGWSANLLPVVSNPNREISADSMMKGLGKTPSQVNFRGHAAGLAKWTKRPASAADIKRWRAESDHGICVQTGNSQGGTAPIVIAIDIDVPDSARSAVIRDALLTALPWHSLPERYREGTGKTLLAFEVEDGGEIFKRVVPVDGGMVELLGLGQQFIAEGTYIDARTGGPNGRYLWRRGGEVPRLTRDEFAVVWDTLTLFAVGEIKFARARRAPIEGADLVAGDDPVAGWIMENWNVYDQDRDGRLFIECPFAGDHTTDSGPTATAYFPAGTGGYQRGHFDCKHAHCCDRDDGEFREAIGFEADQFPDLECNEGEASQADMGRIVALAGDGASANGSDAGTGRGALLGPPRENAFGLTSILENGGPRLIMDGNARPEPCLYNVLKVLGPTHLNWTDMLLGFDEFTSQVMWAPFGKEKPQWRAFNEQDYAKIRAQLDRRPIKPVPVEVVKTAVGAVAVENSIDTAIEWLSRLEWDGVPRVETFIPDTMPGVSDRPYTRALSRYMWTGLAGRVLSPGVKADMIPILVGAEGLRKSSWVAALSPNEEAFAEINLKHRDDDTTRKLRGCMVAELGELQGLNSRDGEEVRAFLSRQFEQWTPKYMEFTRRFKRRCLFFGTTNDEAFLAERMGRRRLLPWLVVDNCDVDQVIAHRDQLWAEAAVIFKRSGVDWSVEKLAEPERDQFSEEKDNWAGAIARWLLSPDPVSGRIPCEDPFGWGTEDVLKGAFSFGDKEMKRADMIRAGAIIRGFGAVKRQGGDRKWKYMIHRSQLAAFVDQREGNAL